MNAFKLLLIWLGFGALATVNGVLRERVMQPLLGRLALPASGLSLIVLILLAGSFMLPWLGPLSVVERGLIGLLWLGMTIAFECGLGRWAMRKPWPELLRAYRFEGGNLWPLVLVTIGLLPFLVGETG